jgi:hypothetical protein
MQITPSSVLLSMWEIMFPPTPGHYKARQKMNGGVGTEIRVLANVLGGIERACLPRHGKPPTLTHIQALHIRELMSRLNEFDTPSAADLEVLCLHSPSNFRPLYVLRDTRGPLNNITVQIVFGLVPRSARTVVLGVFIGGGQLQPSHVAIVVDRFDNYVTYEDLVDP